MNKLADTLIEKQTRNEATTSANIAYLPGGFSKVSAHLKGLAKKKKTWKVQYLPVKERLEVNFEDELVVHVNKWDWCHFIEEAFGSGRMTYAGVDMVELHEDLLNESANEWQKRLDLLTKLVQKTITSDFPCRESFYNVVQFERAFGNGTRLSHNAFVDLSGGRVLVEGLVKKIKAESLEHNPGFMDMLRYRLLEKLPLNDLPILENKEYFTGYKSKVSYGSTVIIFESFVTVDFKINEKLYIWNDDAVAELQDIKGVRVSGNSLVPSRGHFQASIFERVKEAIDIINEQEEDNEHAT